MLRLPGCASFRSGPGVDDAGRQPGRARCRDRRTGGRAGGDRHEVELEHVLVRAQSLAINDTRNFAEGLRKLANAAQCPHLTSYAARMDLLASTYAVVLFSIIIQGSTLGWVAKRTVGQ